MILRIDHVSIAVKDFEGAKHFFESILGAVSGAAAADETMKYFWNIFSAGDLSRLELMKPTGKGSFLDNFLASKKDGGVHHITFETSDIQKAKALLEKNNIPYFGYEETDDGWKELFIHPKDAFGVLIQIAEMADPNIYLSDSVRPNPEKTWSVKKTDTGAVISFAHPGGGMVDIEMPADDIKDLAEALKNIG